MSMPRIGEPGGNNYPFEFKWDGGEAIVYAANMARAVWTFKTSDLWQNQFTSLSIRLMADNE